MADATDDPMKDARLTASRRTVAVVLFAFVLGVVAVVVALVNRSDDPTTVGTPSTTAAEKPPGGITSSSCVETYDLTTLRHRQLAMDGIVKGVEADHLTLKVVAWYRGGSGDEVTLAGASTLSAATSAGPSINLEPGTRLLVAGDSGFAWSCGFTQPYDPSVAKAWNDALAS